MRENKELRAGDIPLTTNIICENKFRTWCSNLIAIQWLTILRLLFYAGKKKVLGEEEGKTKLRGREEIVKTDIICLYL